MATRAVGLDIGTFAVRAAELNLATGVPTLLRFGQVALPPGAVRDGEVIDVAAVGSAIRRLWTQAGFRAKRVVIGVANQRVIIRQADLPQMPEDDLRAALPYEAHELIPIPIDDAVLDFQVLEQVVGSDGEPRTRVLLAAAQRDMIQGHLAAVAEAKLSASRVDVVPFALVRALAGVTDVLGGGTEAIVCVGGGVTNVVVHEDGVPRFVRILSVGGDDITEAIARELATDLDTAEDLKRRASELPGDERTQQAMRVVNERLGPLVEEIRGSLDFYLAQADAAQLRRVLITGGGSRLPGLLDQLQSQLGSNIQPAHTLQTVRLGSIGLSETDLAQAEPLMAVPIGLALADGPSVDGVRRISLLPTEISIVREQRRQNALLAAALIFLAVVLLALWVTRNTNVSHARSQAAAAEARNESLKRQIAASQGGTQVDAQIQSKQAQVTGVLATDVAWTRLLQDVANVIPDDVFLTNFNGNAAGSVTFSASGFDQTSTARWLLRVGDLKSLTALWVPSSSRPTATAPVTFSSQATLTPAARSGQSRLTFYVNGAQ